MRTLNLWVKSKFVWGAWIHIHVGIRSDKKITIYAPDMTLYFILNHEENTRVMLLNDFPPLVRDDAVTTKMI